MTVTTITFGNLNAQTSQGTGVPLPHTAGAISQRLTPVATSITSSIQSDVAKGSLAVVSTDTAIWVKFDIPANSPSAVYDHGGPGAQQNGRFMVPANTAARFVVPAGVVAAIALAS